MKLCIVLIVAMLISPITSAWTVPSGQWMASAPITQMYIYPGYAVIWQGPAAVGPAGCANEGTWSFNWADFSPEEGARIQSLLLAAYVAKTNISPYIATAGCGPENKKKFTGLLHMGAH